MEETLEVTAALKNLSWGKHVAVITDGRFSGVSTGACIGHVGPEALAGGPLGKLRDGDIIQVVIDRIHLEGSIDLIGQADTPPSERSPQLGSRILAGREPAAGFGALPRSARRYTSVGRPAGSQRRHLGRLRL